MAPEFRFLTCADGSIATQPGTATGEPCAWPFTHISMPVVAANIDPIANINNYQIYWPSHAQSLYPSTYPPFQRMVRSATYEWCQLSAPKKLGKLIAQIPEESDQLRVESGPSEVQHISSWAWVGGGWPAADGFHPKWSSGFLEKNKLNTMMDLHWIYHAKFGGIHIHFLVNGWERGLRRCGNGVGS